MDVELRQLRCLVAIVDSGTFTDAAIDLGVSQAAVSRTLASLETALGVRLLRRTSREVAPTAAGTRVIARARRILAETDDLVREATTGHSHLRIGYAWSAMGRHTLQFQRRWARLFPETELQLVRTNSATGGLAEGACDIAVVRTEPDQRRFGGVIVGLERRHLAVAADDPWARRRFVRLAEISDRTVVIDRRSGSTTTDLWPPEKRPAVEYTLDVDDWLTVIAIGRCVGITAESTVTQYPRPGVVFRPVRDAAPIPVRLIWWRDDPHPLADRATRLLTELYGAAERT
ncbi:DNA-binding transcriptional regulator, LysR family [Saccharopolyspora antimicrobica]|uniref:DNA-binding transcriptional LysR family regulator n=1 Tax=Saccharopolyspora antimicrobica TaxID=455193 RepID=A0A1I4RBU7_9PSEU|nr:LysR family transcriptional regulator [Saccharopolyspora antimicrobica]RKT88089.1 DNA-binding transcriptional LysR family regulator [Saccharopolyspora antimicrobica]SFM49353.1 DNA-binding transcriptional regulator, LysR family [Saccharopolyspora antimicrobica]